MLHRQCSSTTHPVFFTQLIQMLLNCLCMIIVGFGIARTDPSIYRPSRIETCPLTHNFRFCGYMLSLSRGVMLGRFQLGRFGWTRLGADEFLLPPSLTHTYFPSALDRTLHPQTSCSATRRTSRNG